MCGSRSSLNTLFWEAVGQGLRYSARVMSDKKEGDEVVERPKAGARLPQREPMLRVPLRTSARLRDQTLRSSTLSASRASSTSAKSLRHPGSDPGSSALAQSLVRQRLSGPLFGRDGTEIERTGTGSFKGVSHGDEIAGSVEAPASQTGGGGDDPPASQTGGGGDGQAVLQKAIEELEGRITPPRQGETTKTEKFDMTTSDTPGSVAPSPVVKLREAQDDAANMMRVLVEKHRLIALATEENTAADAERDRVTNELREQVEMLKQAQEQSEQRTAEDKVAEAVQRNENIQLRAQVEKQSEDIERANVELVAASQTGGDYGDQVQAGQLKQMHELNTNAQSIAYELTQRMNEINFDHQRMFDVMTDIEKLYAEHVDEFMARNYRLYGNENDNCVFVGKREDFDFSTRGQPLMRWLPNIHSDAAIPTMEFSRLIFKRTNDLVQEIGTEYGLARGDSLGKMHKLLASIRQNHSEVQQVHWSYRTKLSAIRSGSERLNHRVQRLSHDNWVGRDLQSSLPIAEDQNKNLDGEREGAGVGLEGHRDAGELSKGTQGLLHQGCADDVKDTMQRRSGHVIQRGGNTTKLENKGIVATRVAMFAADRNVAGWSGILSETSDTHTLIFLGENGKQLFAKTGYKEMILEHLVKLHEFDCCIYIICCADEDTEGMTTHLNDLENRAASLCVESNLHIRIVDEWATEPIAMLGHVYASGNDRIGSSYICNEIIGAAGSRNINVNEGGVDNRGSHVVTNPQTTTYISNMFWKMWGIMEFMESVREDEDMEFDEMTSRVVDYIHSTLRAGERDEHMRDDSDDDLWLDDEWKKKKRPPVYAPYEEPGDDGILDSSASLTGGGKGKSLSRSKVKVEGKGPASVTDGATLAIQQQLTLLAEQVASYHQVQLEGQKISMKPGTLLDDGRGYCGDMSQHQLPEFKMDHEKVRGTTADPTLYAVVPVRPQEVSTFAAKELMQKLKSINTGDLHGKARAFKDIYENAREKARRASPGGVGEQWINYGIDAGRQLWHFYRALTEPQRAVFKLPTNLRDGMSLSLRPADDLLVGVLNASVPKEWRLKDVRDFQASLFDDQIVPVTAPELWFYVLLQIWAGTDREIKIIVRQQWKYPKKDNEAYYCLGRVIEYLDLLDELQLPKPMLMDAKDVMLKMVAPIKNNVTFINVWLQECQSFEDQMEKIDRVDTVVGWDYVKDYCKFLRGMLNRPGILRTLTGGSHIDVTGRAHVKALRATPQGGGKEDPCPWFFGMKMDGTLHPKDYEIRGCWAGNKCTKNHDYKQLPNNRCIVCGSNKHKKIDCNRAGGPKFNADWKPKTPKGGKGKPKGKRKGAKGDRKGGKSKGARKGHKVSPPGVPKVLAAQPQPFAASSKKWSNDDFEKIKLLVAQRTKTIGNQKKKAEKKRAQAKAAPKAGPVKAMVARIVPDPCFKAIVSEVVPVLQAQAIEPDVYAMPRNLLTFAALFNDDYQDSASGTSGSNDESGAGGPVHMFMMKPTEHDDHKRRRIGEHIDEPDVHADDGGSVTLNAEQAQRYQSLVANERALWVFHSEEMMLLDEPPPEVADDESGSDYEGISSLCEDLELDMDDDHLCASYLDCKSPGPDSDEETGGSDEGVNVPVSQTNGDKQHCVITEPDGPPPNGYCRRTPYKDADLDDPQSVDEEVDYGLTPRELRRDRSYPRLESSSVYNDAEVDRLEAFVLGGNTPIVDSEQKTMTSQDGSASGTGGDSGSEEDSYGSESWSFEETDAAIDASLDIEERNRERMFDAVEIVKQRFRHRAPGYEKKCYGCRMYCCCETDSDDLEQSLQQEELSMTPGFQDEVDVLYKNPRWNPIDKKYTDALHKALAPWRERARKRKKQKKIQRALRQGEDESTDMYALRVQDAAMSPRSWADAPPGAWNLFMLRVHDEFEDEPPTPPPPPEDPFYAPVAVLDSGAACHKRPLMSSDKQESMKTITVSGVAGNTDMLMSKEGEICDGDDSDSARLISMGLTVKSGRQFFWGLPNIVASARLTPEQVRRISAVFKEDGLDYMALEVKGNTPQFTGVQQAMIRREQNLTAMPMYSAVPLDNDTGKRETQYSNWRIRRVKLVESCKRPDGRTLRNATRNPCKKEVIPDWLNGKVTQFEQFRTGERSFGKDADRPMLDPNSLFNVITQATARFDVQDVDRADEFGLVNGWTDHESGSSQCMDNYGTVNDYALSDTMFDLYDSQWNKVGAHGPSASKTDGASRDVVLCFFCQHIRWRDILPSACDEETVTVDCLVGDMGIRGGHDIHKGRTTVLSCRAHGYTVQGKHGSSKCSIATIDINPDTPTMSMIMLGVNDSRFNLQYLSGTRRTRRLAWVVSGLEIDTRRMRILWRVAHENPVEFEAQLNWKKKNQVRRLKCKSRTKSVSQTDGNDEAVTRNDADHKKYLDETIFKPEAAGAVYGPEDRDNTSSARVHFDDMVDVFPMDLCIDGQSEPYKGSKPWQTAMKGTSKVDPIFCEPSAKHLLSMMHNDWESICSMGLCNRELKKEFRVVDAGYDEHVPIKTMKASMKEGERQPYRSMLDAVGRAKALGVHIVDTVEVTMTRPISVPKFLKQCKSLCTAGEGTTNYHIESGQMVSRQISPDFLCWARMGAMFHEGLTCDHGFFQDCELTSFARSNYWDPASKTPIDFDENNEIHVNQLWTQIACRFPSVAQGIWPSKTGDYSGLAYAGACFRIACMMTKEYSDGFLIKCDGSVIMPWGFDSQHVAVFAPDERAETSTVVWCRALDDHFWNIYEKMMTLTHRTQPDLLVAKMTWIKMASSPPLFTGFYAAIRCDPPAELCETKEKGVKALIQVHRSKIDQEGAKAKSGIMKSSPSKDEEKCSKKLNTGSPSPQEVLPLTQPFSASVTSGETRVGVDLLPRNVHAPISKLVNRSKERKAKKDKFVQGSPELGTKTTTMMMMQLDEDGQALGPDHH